MSEKDKRIEEQLKFLNMNKPLQFYTEKKIFFGGSTYSIIAYYMYIEKKQKQE